MVGLGGGDGDEDDVDGGGCIGDGVARGGMETVVMMVVALGRWGC